jgi:hypothetical protein
MASLKKSQNVKNIDQMRTHIKAGTRKQLQGR